MTWFYGLPSRTVIIKHIYIMNKPVWRVWKEDISWDTMGDIVPNDEYAEFRKAECDGKEIEYNNSGLDGSPNWLPMVMYKNVLKIMNFEMPVERYRVKLEIEIKVGDWVRMRSLKSHNIR